MARLQSVAGVQVAADGSSIAYLVDVPRIPFVDDDGKSRQELHVRDVGDGSTRSLMLEAEAVSDLRWRPEGGLAFLAKETAGDDDEAKGEAADKEKKDTKKKEGKALWLVDPAKLTVRKALAHPAGIHDYAFSPDGTQLAYIATEPESDERQAREEKGFTAEIYEEDWSPRGLWVTSLEAETVDGASKARQLPLTGAPVQLAWGQDLLAVSVAPTPLIDDEYMNQQVVLVDPSQSSDQGEPATVKTPGKLGRFRFSPDGQHLALIAAQDRNDPAEGRLVVAGSEGGSPRDLLPELEGHVADFAWVAPDRLVYVAEVGLYSEVGSVGLDGERQVLLQAPEPGPEPHLVFDSLAASADGKVLAAQVHTAEHPPELYVARNGGNFERATDTNPWLANRALAPQEGITYKARDGLELQGVLLRPSSTGPAPLILMVHGGPEARVPGGWVTNYSRPGQVAAGDGHVVFYPNYRGSTGRGVKFSKLGQEDYAGKEFDDLVDAIDHLASDGLVNREKVGITGGSYGGYASAWAATKLTEHFAASVMFVGISNKISKAGTTDIPIEMEAVHGRRWVFDDNWQWFLERSPIRWVKEARTPILILHGKDDPRVHPEQSIQLYRLLKMVGKVPVRLVLYPGEGHGNKKAAARYDYTLRLMRWMNHYLRGPGGDPPPRDLVYPLQQEASTASATTSNAR